MVFSLAVAVFLTPRILKLSNKPCANTLTCREPLVEQVDNETLGTFLGQTVAPPKIDILSQALQPTTTVLGDSDPQSDKHIYIDLDRQMLYAYEAENLVISSLISTGRWGWTPVGNYAIQSKFRSTRMSGGSGSDYYNLPNVPYTMFFNGDFGIHGAYWHNNFGTPMSHGCVNMRTVDAQTLFEWADGPQKGAKGTPVSVCQSFIAPSTCIQDQKVHMPQPAALPDAYNQDATERTSGDGSKVLSVTSKPVSSTANLFTLNVQDAKTGQSQTVASLTLENSMYVNLPYNTWSPSNTYFFVEYKTSSGAVVDVHALKATAEASTQFADLSAVTAFEKKQSSYAFDRVTGWASNTLLIVNSRKLTDDSKGPSFWYEVPSQAVIQLSQQF